MKHGQEFVECHALNIARFYKLIGAVFAVSD